MSEQVSLTAVITAVEKLYPGKTVTRASINSPNEFLITLDNGNMKLEITVISNSMSVTDAYTRKVIDIFPNAIE